MQRGGYHRVSPPQCIHCLSFIWVNKLHRFGEMNLSTQLSLSPNHFFVFFLFVLKKRSANKSIMFFIIQTQQCIEITKKNCGVENTLFFEVVVISLVHCPYQKCFFFSLSTVCS